MSVVVQVLMFPIFTIISIKFGYYCWLMTCHSDSPLSCVTLCGAMLETGSVAGFTRDNKEHIMGSFVSIAAY